MKNKILLGLGIGAGSMMFAVTAFAASATITPSSITAKVGETFTLTIAVDSQGAPNYGDKVEIDYPTGVTSVTAYDIGKPWLELSHQAGYDSYPDITSGLFLKTAGYPGGFTGVKTFETVTFKARKEGTGVIKIGSGSASFASASGSTSPLSGSSIPVTVVAVGATPSPSASASPSVSASTTEVVATPIVTEEPSPEVTPDQTAAVATSGIPNWAIILIILIALGVIYFLIKRRRA